MGMSSWRGSGRCVRIPSVKDLCWVPSPWLQRADGVGFCSSSIFTRRFLQRSLFLDRELRWDPARDGKLGSLNSMWSIKLRLKRAARAAYRGVNAVSWKNCRTELFWNGSSSLICLFPQRKYTHEQSIVWLLRNSDEKVWNCFQEK